MPQKNLMQKLVELRKEVCYLKRDSKGYSWAYADEESLLMILRPIMDRLGIWVDQEIVSLEYQDVNIMSKSGPTVVSVMRAEVAYNIVDADNPSDFIRRSQFICEPGVDAKTVGSISTYANRYFWFRFLQIPQGKKDYIEEARPISREELERPAPAPSPEELGQRLMSHFNENDRTPLQGFIKWLSKETGKPVAETISLCLANIEKTRKNFNSWKGQKTIPITA